MHLYIMFDVNPEHSTFEIPETESDVMVLAGNILAPGYKAIVWAASDKVSHGRPNVKFSGNYVFYGQKFQVVWGMMTSISFPASSGNQVSTRCWKAFLCQNVTCIIKLIYFRTQHPNKKTILRCNCPTLFLQLTFDMKDQLPPQLTAWDIPRWIFEGPQLFRYLIAADQA